MEMPVKIMHGAFPDFFIPGMLLLGLGILNSVSFITVLRRAAWDWILACLALGGLVIWFIVEMIILRELHWLHLMWGLPVLLGSIAAIPLVASSNNTAAMQKALLSCGVISSLWYIAINFYVPEQYTGYSTTSFTVSELSAIGAPTRILWTLLVLPYPVLFSAFGWGVLQTSGAKHFLRITGYLIIAYCIFNLYWPPMHMRGQDMALTDILHIAWAIVTNVFMWTFMLLGAMALGKGFRIYTFVSIFLHVVFGILTFLEAPEIPKNGPTNMIGVWERINILIFMIWVAVFAIILFRISSRTRPEKFSKQVTILNSPVIPQN
jgi:hypothetical protein